MTTALYALLGVVLGSLIGPLVVFVLALCAGDGEELGRVLSIEEWRGRQR